MLPASELRSGMAVRVEGVLYKVIGADYRGGGGKMGGVTHAKLRNLETGTLREWRFRGDQVVEEVLPERQTMQFLYSDADASYFMHAESFEQVGIPHSRIGRAVHFLKEDMTLPVEFFDGQPMSLTFPDIVDTRVASTAPPVHTQGNDNVWKAAMLENGVDVMVPPFIAPGELIRVEVETGKYVERAKTDRRR
jgi:elongation factor P